MHRISIPKSSLAFGLILALFASSLQASQPEAARELILGMSNDLIATLKAEREAIKKDHSLAYQLADSKVLPHIDFQRIGRWVLGKHWRRANPEQQKRFVEEFRVLLTHTYVTAMVTYLDQIIEKSDNVRYLPMRSTPDADDVTVRTEILLDNNTKVPVNFSMWSTKGGWKIYDVTVDGISLATTYRSSFSSQISRDGLDTLLVRLEEKNNRYTTSNNSNDNSDGNTSNNTGKPVVKASH